MPICSFVMEWNSHPLWSQSLTKRNLISSQLQVDSLYSIMLLVANFMPLLHDAIWNDVKRVWHLLFPLFIVKFMTGINVVREICQNPSTVIWGPDTHIMVVKVVGKYCPTSSFGILAKQESPSFCEEIKSSDRSIFQPKGFKKVISGVLAFGLEDDLKDSIS